MAIPVVTINGTERPYRNGSVNAILNINGRSTLAVDIWSPDGSYIPEFEDDVVLTDDTSGSIHFAGMVMDPEEKWLVQGKSHVMTRIDCEDYTSYADRILVTATTTGGISGRDAVDYVVSLMTDFGVTRDAGMPAGATLGELTYDHAKGSDVMNDIVRLAAPAGWVWYIDAAKVLRAWAPSLSNFPCPFSITPTTTNIVGDVRVTRSRQYYANRVYVVYGNGTAAPGVVMRQNTGEQLLYGLFETVVRVEGPIDEPTAEAIGDSVLTRSVVRPQTIVFDTLTPGARPGLTIDVDLPLRQLAGEYLITQVGITDIPGAGIRYKVTATEGGVLAPSWMDAARSAAGGGSGLANAGTVVVSPGVLSASTMHLGGASDQGVVPGSGAWKRVVNPPPFVSPATRTATVRAELWARSGSVTVTARLRDLSTGSTVGTSAGITGSTPTLTSFSVSLVASRRYELQLSADANDEEVYGLGSLEFL